MKYPVLARVFLIVRAALSLTVIAVFLLLFIFGVDFFLPLPKCHLGPALGACALGAIIVVLLLTLLFGRVYCSFLCPFGAVQDVLILWRRQKERKNFIITRYFVLGFILGGLFAGSSLIFLLFDPYSGTGRLLTLGGILTAILLIVLTFWGRIFCNTLCPVGALLGFFARFSLFKLRMGESCVSCGLCQKHCLAGCINAKEKQIDNERCLRCLNCLPACRKGALRFTASSEKKILAQPNLSRRAFLVQGSAALVGAALGAGLPLGAKKLFNPEEYPIFPPGAGNSLDFYFKCTNCRLCVTRCPQKLIVSPKSGIGPVRLKVPENFCRFNCNNCSNVCPTGALKPLDLLTKQKTVIGKAILNPQYCNVFQKGTACGRCGNACPTKAMTLRANGTPILAQKKCIGCGLCAKLCPAEPKAITLKGVPAQETLA